MATTVIPRPTTARGRVEDLLCRAGAYRVSRNAYQRLFNREQHVARERDKAFFRTFVAPGGLVFDVGANQGRVTQAFAEIGARVVAIEPNPVLAEKVRARYGGPAVTVIASALGDAEGEAELALGVDSGHSTISDEWQASAADASHRWSGSVTVPVTTLSAVIAQHGRPDFVKIDVEGYEPQVLSGLGEAVPALSFEFLCAVPDVPRRCLELIGELGDYEYNMAKYEAHDLSGRPWSDAATLLADLDALRAENPTGYGDVYARLKR